MNRVGTVIGAVCVASLGVGAGLVACGTNNTAGPDASVDAPADMTVADNAQPETGAMDAGVDADAEASVGCTPGDVTGFSPPAYVPALGPYTNGCDFGSAQLQDFWNDCYGGDAASAAACTQFVEAGSGNVTCAACLDTLETASSYGPIVEGVGGKELNLAGCVQNAVATDAGYACAEDIQAAERCVEKACKANCPITDMTSRAAYIACTKQAATGGCSTFTAAATGCYAAFVDAGTGQIATCVPGATVDDTFIAYGLFFCGS
jgi:hypothetical protein